MELSLSIVIPNFNGKELLELNLPFVYSALKFFGISDFDIIIPDDASTDNSVVFIKENYPEIILIENNTNKGFAGNTNTGILKSKKELVFVLNSDVRLTDNYFQPLITYFEKPDTFGVTGRIIGLDSDRIQDGAKYPNYHYGSISSTANYISKSRNSLYSFFLTGANALMDRKKLIELGGYNELFNPYYGEDVDLGLRAWRLGYKCYYENNAVCRHPNSATIKKEPSEKIKIVSKRNKMFLHFIHLNNFELFYYLFVFIIKLFLKTLLFDFKYLRSFWLFFNSIDECIKSKRQFRKLQKSKNLELSVNDIVKIIKENIQSATIERF